MAIETFKIVYGQSPQYLQDFISIKDTSYNFRYTKLLEKPRTKSARYGTNSFRFQAANLWNSLPEDARKITSLIILDSSLSPGMAQFVNVPYVSNQTCSLGNGLFNPPYS